ncbi:MAG TPA: hypothetical protein PKJ97_02450 [Candidatus Bilamarchaeaceae archaeon]|nr:hypothetical protein [Candidatus Bilamarchaeaceae archaeon]
MKHRILQKGCERKHTEAERFEKWLKADRIGIGKPRNGTRAQEIAIYANLEDAARAPFDTDTKVSILSSLFMPSNPKKSLLVLNALLEMADGGSENARESFESLAEKWLNGPSIRHFSMRDWAKGVVLILRGAELLKSPHLKRTIEKISRGDPETGTHIEFWKGAIRLGCEPL